MRKLFAILLLTLMLFNLVGYKLLFSYLDNRAVADMVENLDGRTYNRASLVEIKVALHLPYTTENKDFERYDGTILLDGVSYNYVERKISNDTLVLHCLPNEQRDHLQKAQKEYAGAINDFQHPQKSGKGSVPSLLKSLLTEFTGHDIVYQYTAPAVILTTYKTADEMIATDRFITSPEQPPELV